MQRNQTDWHIGQQTTINEVFRQSLERVPNKTFLDFSGTKISYREFDERCNALAHGLVDLGLAKGKTVVTLMDNALEGVLLWFAAARIGAIYVAINTAYKGDFLRHQVNDAGAEIVVADADYLERMVAIADELPNLKHLIYRGQTQRHVEGNFSFGSIDDHYLHGKERLELEVAPGDIVALIYTAGTTGPSKGCMMVHNQMCNVAQQTIESDARSEDEIAWTCLPFFHNNALCCTILAQAMIGGTAAVSPRFSVSNFWHELERSGASIATGLGTMQVFLAQAPDNDAMLRYKGKLRVMRGAPWPGDLQRVWQERFGVKMTGSGCYGITEACNVTSLKFGIDAPFGSSGMRNDDFDVRIVDDLGRELPPGESGEVVCRPLRPNVMFKGYWNRPADTLKVMDDLWMHMGDIGRFDADGFFYFVDRKKDYMRRRGENISSYEMETAFLRHADLEEVAVHAVKTVSEDDVKVTVVLKAGSTLTEERLARWAIDNLPYFAVPRYFEFRKTLPKNPVGRILKYQLREEGCTPATWDLEKSGITFSKR